MMKKIIYASLFLSPVVTLAADANEINQLKGLGTLTTSLTGLVNSIIPFLIGLAIVFFFWGLVQYVRASGDPAEAEKGKSTMIYGIVAIAVMVSLFGIIGWLQGTLGVDGGSFKSIPKITPAA